MSEFTQTAPGAPAAPLAWSFQRALPELALLSAFLAIWIVQNPAYGIAHDSMLYSFQALARVHPELYAQDIYLRYGSQDKYTLFSPLFALAIGRLGTENAAVLFTLLAQAAFFAGAAWLARLLMPARLAWLGLALLCAVPGYYGNGNIFLLAEDFATPRLFAEAATIFGLVFFLKRRFWLAGMLAVASLLLHPLMCAGGIVLALCTSTTPPRVRAWAFGAGAVAGLILLGLFAVRGTPLTLDGTWLVLMRTSLTYLWVSQWYPSAWSQTIVCMTTLAIGVLALERSHARSLSRAALIAGVGGIALSYVTVDLLHIALALQVQMWRWSWVAVLFAALLAPLIAHRLWSLGTLGRCTALLLAAAWLWRTEGYAIGIAALALLAAISAKRPLVLQPPNVPRLLLAGSIGVLALACASHVFTQTLVGPALGDYSMVPQAFRDIRAVAKSGMLLFAAFVLIWLAVQRLHALAPRLVITGATVLALAMLLPWSVGEWSVRWYSRNFDDFAQWRAVIPPRTEVLWFDSPVGVWLLLQRPSYLSNAQESSALFSRPAAEALKHRSELIRRYLYGELGAPWVEHPDRTKPDADKQAAQPVPLADLCSAAPDLRFLVTERDMLAPPAATLPPTVAPRYRHLRLYRCEAPHG